MTKIVIEVTDSTLNMSDATQISVRVARWGGELETVAHATLHGVMADMLPTYVGKAIDAWAYEATPRDVARACAQARSLARRHARAYERRGGD